MWVQMPRNCLLVLLSLVTELQSSAHPSKYDFNFNYMHHGQDWQQAECGSRERQSPIDFDANALQLAIKDNFYFEYEKTKAHFRLQNNGHSLAANLIGKGFGGVTLHGQWFNLLSVNFHTQSEHTFHGQRMPLELHLVHREAETNHILVVAVPFTAPPSIGAGFLEAVPASGPRFVISTGPRGPRKPSAGDLGFNPALQSFLSYPLPHGGNDVEVNLPTAMDLISPLLADGVFFHYSGSLTVPPCSEQVTWLVRRDPLMASASQVELIASNIKQATQNNGNWRSTMPLMGRIITLMSATKGAPKVDPDLPPKANSVLGSVDLGAVQQAKHAWEQAGKLENVGKSLSGGLAEGSKQVVQVLPDEKEDFVAKGTEVVGDLIPPADPEVQLRRIQEAVAEQMQDSLVAAGIAEDSATAIKASPLLYR